MSFVLDGRLASSCACLGDWPLSRVLLKNNADYPWCILVPREETAQAIDHLSMVAQQQLMREISALSSIVREYFKSSHINVGALGLIVSQLHIHVVGRSPTDRLWPHGIWQEALQHPVYLVEDYQRLQHDLSMQVTHVSF